MAQIAIGVVVNIAVGLALNALFPPPDLTQEGPRLTDLDVSSAAYGRPVNIPFGTVRVAGNIIWGTPIEEVQSRQTSGGKGLGGGTSTTITYTYFASFDISFAISGADDILRLWADGKLIFDKSAPPQELPGGPFSDIISAALGKEALVFTFYPGGATQQRDPLEEANLGTADTPAYRHLSRIVFNRMPLADFGNRIPNITAEITFNGTSILPFIGMSEVAGTILPGVDNYIHVDDAFNSYFTLTANTNGQLRVDLDTGVVQTIVGNPINGVLEPGYGHGIMLGAQTADNFVPVHRVNALTGELELSAADVAAPWVLSNGIDGYFEVMKVGHPAVGEVRMGIKAGRSIVTSTVYLFNADTLQFIDSIFPALGTPITNEFEIVIPDDDRGSDSGNMYIVSANGTETRVGKFAFTVTQGVSPVGLPTVDVGIELTTVGDFTFPAGDARPRGWAVDASTGRLIISNAVSTVLYDPETASVVINTLEFAFSGRHNYVRSGRFGTAQGTTTTGEIVVVNVADLSVFKRLSISELGLSGNNSVDDTTSVWDDRAQAVIFSRRSAGSGDPGERVLRVFINRATGSGIALSELVQSLCTEYQDIVMAGLEPADLDVSPLVPFTVEGYNLSRQTNMRDALEPLRRAYLFDVVQSDWIMKFPLRGAEPVLTIPEEEVGRAQFADEGNTEFVQEMRTQETELPMRLNVRYTNRETNYDTDVEHSKRILEPVQSMFSKNEKTFDLPIVFADGTLPKQIAEKWLWTIWNERTQFKMIIPWTYLKLDPTDVFLMGLFGETHRLRAAEQDVGISHEMEITGVREASFTFASTIAASGAAGFINQNIKSEGATKLILLDAPLLTLADLNQGQSSAAYTLMGSFVPGWPGAITHISPDGIVFTPVVTSNAEMAWGTVTVPPGQWGEAKDCGDFPNRFQETTEGGTMTINVQRRDDAFISVTELDVMNRANALGVVTPNGVEIIQFQDVVIPDAERPTILRLDRLLRGRLGTEDIAVLGGPVLGSEVVLLRGDPTSDEDASIGRQNLPFGAIGSSRSYKAVTIGTTVDDAPSRIFTYTGRDLRPYSPAHVLITGATDKTVVWTRRTRLSGEWRDGTGAVPLNEAIHEYDVSLITLPSTDVKVILPFDGADDDVNTVDKSTFARTISLGSLAALSTEQKQFGPTSVKFSPDGALNPSNAFVSAADSDDFIIGVSVPFTVQGWIRFTDLTANGQVFASKYLNTGNQREWLIRRNGTDLEALLYANGSTALVTLNGTWTDLAIDTWFHIALDRDAADVIRLYLNGVVIASTTNDTAIFNGTAPLLVGKFRSAGGADDPVFGYVDDFAFVVDRAIFGGAFTPSATPFPIGQTTVVIKRVVGVETTIFTQAELDQAAGQALEVHVEQISATGLKSPAAKCLII